MRKCFLSLPICFRKKNEFLHDDTENNVKTSNSEMLFTITIYMEVYTFESYSYNHNPKC